MKKYNVAVVGATGNVGREILNILDDRNFPINKIFAVASSRSDGLKISYGSEKELEVQSLDTFNFKKIELVLSCILYTSDAADEGLGVDLGGRRLIK